METPNLLNYKTISVIGAGGKTTLCLALALSLPGKRVFTTSTHICVPDALISLENPDAGALKRALDQNGAVCVHGCAVETDRPLPWPKVGAPEPDVMAAVFAESDRVVIEADGAKGRLLKAHGAHEPVILPQTDLVLCVANLGALGRPLSETVHRVEQVGRVFGKAADAIVTEADIAAAVAAPRGLHKNYCAVLNCAADEQAAERIRALLAEKYQIPSFLIPVFPVDERLTDRIAARLY